MSQRYSVIVYAGTPSPQVVRRVGPFPSADAASAWCERERLGQVPVAGEWASVIPQPAPDDGGDA